MAKSEQQINSQTVIIAVLSALLLAIPMTIFLTSWLLNPQGANAAEFAEQNANTKPVVNNYYYEGGPQGCSQGSAKASSASGGTTSVSEWMPTSQGSYENSVEQNQTETNNIDNSTTTTTTYTNNMPFNLTDSFNIIDSFTVRGDTNSNNTAFSNNDILSNNTTNSNNNQNSNNFASNNDVDIDTDVDATVDSYNNNRQSVVDSEDVVNNAPRAGDIDDAIILTGALGLDI